MSDVATRMFGEEIPPNNIVGETLLRATQEYDFETPAGRAELKRCVESELTPTSDYATFSKLALTSWIEDTFGLRQEAGTSRLLRQTPRSIRGNDGAAAELAALTGCSEDHCVTAIQRYLEIGCQSTPSDTEYPPLFAFRLYAPRQLRCRQWR